MVQLESDCQSKSIIISAAAKPRCQHSARPFPTLCALMCQLINATETLAQRGSLLLLPGRSPAPLDLCVTDRCPRCSSAQKTACVCTFFLSLPLTGSLTQCLMAATWASTYTNGGTSGRSASVALLAASACLTDCGGRARQTWLLFPAGEQRRGVCGGTAEYPEPHASNTNKHCRGAGRGGEQGGVGLASGSSQGGRVSSSLSYVSPSSSSAAHSVNYPLIH